jgi:hypothetical protein
MKLLHLVAELGHHGGAADLQGRVSRPPASVQSTGRLVNSFLASAMTTM